MVTSPINPMRYWKLEEIQRMLNEIEGYENVVVEFKYTPSNGWNSDHWDCTCGIKELLVNGEWNWLLKYEFQVNDKLELADVRLAAFQEMAERLVRDIWRTSINSFRKQQRELNNLHNKTPLIEEQTKNLITKIENMTNKKTMTNNILSRLNTDNIKAWLVTLGGATAILTFIYVLNQSRTGVVAFLYVVFFGLVSFALWMIKEIIRERIFNE